MKMNLFDKITTVVAILLLLGATIYLFLNWSLLPAEIPSHYNFKGEPDDYGGKGTLIFTLIMGWTLVLLFWILGKFPKYWNTGVERTPANEAAVNRIIKDMMDVLQVAMAAMFSYMLVVPVLGTYMGNWFMPVFLISIFGTILLTAVRLIRNR